MTGIGYKKSVSGGNILPWSLETVYMFLIAWLEVMWV